MLSAAASSGDAGTGVTSTNNYFYLHGAPAGNSTGDVKMPTCLCYVINSKLNATQKAQKIQQLTPNSYVVLMTEKRMVASELPTSDSLCMTWYTKSLGQLKAEEKRFTARHKKGGHLLFVDGHVSWFSNHELQVPYQVAPVYDYNDPGKVVWDPFGPEGLSGN
jgi:prepilin-type processing-associated H-X9-DG protein